MPLVAAVATVCVLTGALLAVAGLRKTPVPATRPRRSSRRISPGRVDALWSRTARRTKVLLGAGLGVGVLVALTTGWLVAVVVLPAAAVGVPFLLSSPAGMARITRLKALEEWTRALAGVLTAGQGIEQAILATRRSTPPQIRTEVHALAARLEARWDTARALRAFADDIDDTTGDMVAGALILGSRRRGAGLASVLSDLAQDVAADVRARRAVESDRAKPRGVSRIITIITLSMLALLALLGDYVAPYGTPVGQVILLVLLGAYVLVLLYMRWMTRGDVPARFIGRQLAPGGTT